MRLEENEGIGDTEAFQTKPRPMSSANHDTLVYRLAQILIKLNQGERLDPLALADEFGVNPRTIQRDLNERFAYLPLEKVNGRYRLDPVFLGKLSTRDIERFAGLAGVRGLFPSLGDDFLRDIFDRRLQETLLVRGHHYEDLSGKEALFKELEAAIAGCHLLAFDYAKPDGVKRYPTAAPYRLLNQKGIWYLAAVDGGKLKTFSFSKLSNLSTLDEIFVRDAEIDARLLRDEGIWLTERQLKVRLLVAPDVAGYFKRRRLIANQVVEEERGDGSLVVSAEVGHPNQILPIVRYWVPHIRILEPVELQAELNAGLKAYLETGRHETSR
jgi:predicted DNA-binding transcriptional regulator YafY